MALGHALYWSGNEEQGVEVLERALADYPDLELELRHRLEAELVVNATRVVFALRACSDAAGPA